jgi:hypothetical protein
MHRADDGNQAQLCTAEQAHRASSSEYHTVPAFAEMTLDRETEKTALQADDYQPIAQERIAMSQIRWIG